MNGKIEWNTNRSLLSILFVFALITSCGGGGGGSDSATNEPGTPSTIVLEYEVDNTRAVSTAMDNTGGSLLLLNAEPGIDVNIDVPASSLVADSVIGMTPVTSIQSMPTGFHPLVAVRLEPEYQAFGAPVRITFDMPQGFRNGKAVVGFFTKDDGSEFYMTPPLSPSGEFAAHDEDTLTITKSSFSVGGLAEVDQGFHGGEKNWESQINDIIIEVTYRFLLGTDDGDFTEKDIVDFTAILTDWNQELHNRLARMLNDLSYNGVTEDNTRDLLGIIAERMMLESFMQNFNISSSAIDNFLTQQTLEDSLNTLIESSFDKCITTNIQQVSDSEKLRLNLFSLLQKLDVNAIPTQEDIFCFYRAELQPPFTYLDNESEAAEVSLVLKSVSPVTGQADRVVPGATFSSPIALLVSEESDNVFLVDFDPDLSDLRFTVQGIYVETVGVSNDDPGSRLVNSATASGQIGSIFSGTYSVEYSRTASSCTDPDDEGTESGQLQTTAESQLLSIENGLQTHLFTASGGGAGLRLTIVRKEGDATATVSGNATYTENETEIINIDREDVECTYTTDSSGSVNGMATISDDSITIVLESSDVETSYSGSPVICGSGSCAVATSELTLNRISGP
jgi:hypothetical protein